jgi:hypothetical protein
MGTRFDTWDTVGQYDTDNPFDCKMTTFMYPRLTGKYVNAVGVTVADYDNYPIGYRPTLAQSSQAPFDRPPDWSDLATDVAGKTNPSSPHVSLPVFIGEMRDFKDLAVTPDDWRDWMDHLPSRLEGWRKLGSIPLQIYLAGRKLLKALAAGHLAWQFAAKPMIGDISKLLGFTRACQARVNALMKLASGSGLKRRVLLGEQRFITPWDAAETTVHSQGCYIKAVRRVHYRMSQWATVRWSLVCPTYLDSMDSEAMLDLARRLTLGLTGYEVLSAAWELLPWSWLIDWFFNFGSWIAAFNNTIPCTLTSLCYMRTTSSLTEYKITQKPSWLDITGEMYEKEVRKERIPLNPLLAYLPLVTQPALGVGQMSILGSLATLKLRW